MARRKRSTSTKTIVRTVRAPAPVIRVSAPRAAPKQKRRRSSSSSGGGSGGLQKSILGAGVGGFAYGFIEKQFPTLPVIPLIGKPGTIALIAYFVGKRGGQFAGIARDTGVAAAAIAGYEFGKTGRVSGDIAPQVSGIAAQV